MEETAPITIDTPDLVGLIERLSATEIRGWAVYKRDPKRPLKVVVASEVGTLHCPVSTYRHDLTAAGLSNPYAGFSVSPAAFGYGLGALETETAFTLSVQCEGAPIYEHRFRLATDRLRAGRYRWSIGIRECLRIAGWVTDRLRQGTIQLEIENTATKRSIRRPTEPGRTDLVGSRGDELSGFDIAMPWEVRLNSSTFTLSVVEGPERVLLATFNLPPMFGRFEAVTKMRQIEGWVVNAGDPAMRPVVELLVDGSVVASGRAALYRTDLRPRVGYDGFHGFVVIGPPSAAAEEFQVRASLPDGEWIFL